MLSIRDNITELERLVAERDAAIDCYRDSLRNVADYTIELDDHLTSQQRRFVSDIAENLNDPTPEALREASATLRALLRSYRGKAAEFLNHIREQLASTARALEEVMESLAQTDDDSETRLHSAIAGLRELAERPAAAPVREQLLGAADMVCNGVEELQKLHEAHVAQFKTEIRMLHNRIGQLESAASIDSVTQLLTRGEVERQIRSLEAGRVSLLLIAASGLRLCEMRFSNEVAAELAGAFTKRLRNNFPARAVLGRWSAEEFVAILQAPAKDAIGLAKGLGDQLSGAYSCLMEGRVVRPDLQVRVTVLEFAEGTADRLLSRVRELTRHSPAPE